MANGCPSQLDDFLFLPPAALSPSSSSSLPPLCDFSLSECSLSPDPLGEGDRPFPSHLRACCPMCLLTYQRLRSWVFFFIFFLFFFAQQLVSLHLSLHKSALLQDNSLQVCLVAFRPLAIRLLLCRSPYLPKSCVGGEYLMVLSLSASFAHIVVLPFCG